MVNEVISKAETSATAPDMIAGWSFLEADCINVLLTPAEKGCRGSIFLTGLHALHIFCNNSIIVHILFSSVCHFSELLNRMLLVLSLSKPVSRVGGLRFHQPPAPN